MRKIFQKGFGLGFVILVIAALFVVGAGGTVAINKVYKDKQTLEDFESSLGNFLETGDEAAGENLGKTKAVVTLLGAYPTNPQKIDIMCSAQTSEDIVAFHIYPGDGASQIGDATENIYKSPTEKSRSVSYTYSAPGQYTISCVPQYSDEEEVDLNSLHQGSLLIEIQQKQGALPPVSLTPPPASSVTPPPPAAVAKDTIINLEISPTSGTQPVDVTFSCSAGAVSPMVGLSIHRGAYAPLKPGENEDDRFLYISEGFESSSWTYGGVTRYNTPGAGGFTTIGGYFFDGELWKRRQLVYCTVEFSDGTTTSSDPIEINYN